MRVAGAGGAFANLPEKDPIGAKKKAGQPARPAGSPPPTFIEELQAAVLEEETLDHVDFAVLIGDVDRDGRELLAHQDDAHLKKYRESVKKFLTAAVKMSYRVQVVEGRGPNPKLYVFVERIEGKLDELTRTVLASHKDPLRLLSQIEELRGLLLDLKT